MKHVQPGYISAVVLIPIFGNVLTICGSSFVVRKKEVAIVGELVPGSVYFKARSDVLQARRFGWYEAVPGFEIQATFELSSHDANRRARIGCIEG